MRIYTRSGDKGNTSLFSGERVAKDELRVEAYGTLDELNSVLGVAWSSCTHARIRAILLELQNELFIAGADLATLKSGRIQPDRIWEQDWRNQEKLIDDLTAELPRLKNFILPASPPGPAMLHFARSVCRRAERLIVRLQREEGDVNPELLIYVNRLSDLLFVLARYENIQEGGEEIIWKGRK